MVCRSSTWAGRSRSDACRGGRPENRGYDIAFARTAHDAGVAPQVSTGTFVPSDTAVDRLAADGQAAGVSPHAGDLLGAVSTANQRGYLSHFGDTDVSATAASTSTRRGVAVGLLGSVHGVVVGEVTSQFAPDRTGVALQTPGDLCVRASGHSEGRNCVSFFLGELVVRRHGCNPVPGRMRRRSVSPLPTHFGDVLHLPCESTMPNHRVNRTAGGRWRKRKGVARVRLDDGTVALAEVHWYEASGIGKVEFKIKRFI